MKIDMSNHELVIQAQSGDKDAFSQLMRLYQSGILSSCRRYTRQDEDAEDLALETFVEAYQKLERLRSPEAFGRWIHRIAANLCRSWYRSQKTAPLPLEFDPQVWIRRKGLMI
jgi:RNA polymerase sigma-70 factor (ECF subfamily)